MKKYFALLGVGFLLFFLSFYAVGFIIIVLSGFLLYKEYSNGYSGGKDEKNWLEEIDTIDYKHQYKRDGIAVDKQNRKLYLKNGSNEKSYSFSDVREWSTNIASGGKSRGATNIGNVGAAVGESIRIKKENKRRTGLFINVKDVDNPKWKISFKYNGEKSNDELENQLARWMEILNQSINEN